MEVFKYLLFFLSFNAYAIETIHMEVGEQKHLDLIEQGKVHVSRRGIVHVQQEENKRWSVSALRRGIVVIQTESRQGERTQNYMIKVGMAQTGQSIQEKLPKSQFEIKGKIVLIRKKDVKEYGQQQIAGLAYDFANHIAMGGLVATLQGIESSHDVQVIGEPSGLAESGTPLLFKSGGETLFIVEVVGEKSSRPRPVWKEYGVSLLLTTTEAKNSLARIELDFSLRHPTQSGNNSDLSLNQIKTNISIPYDKDIVVGEADVLHDTKTRDDVPVLSSIPFIGPLFSHESDTKQKSKVFIVMHIKKLQIETKTSGHERPTE